MGTISWLKVQQSYWFKVTHFCKLFFKQLWTLFMFSLWQVDTLIVGRSAARWLRKFCWCETTRYTQHCISLLSAEHSLPTNQPHQDTLYCIIKWCYYWWILQSDSVCSYHYHWGTATGWSRVLCPGGVHHQHHHHTFTFNNQEAGCYITFFFHK